MFTFRAECWSKPDFANVYIVHEADTYDVRPIHDPLMMPGPIATAASLDGSQSSSSPPKSGTAVTLRRGNWPIFHDDTLSLFVGSECPFAVVFVMNEKGKTIDTIR